MSEGHPITVSAWTLGNKCSFEERIKAAANAGFEGVGLRAETYVDALAEGYTDQDLLAMLDKYQIKCTEVEDIFGWCEDPRSYEQKYKEQICFHMCALFGVKHVNTGLMEKYSIDYTAQKLRELAERAGKLTVTLEPMPYGGLTNFARTWQILQKAGRDNVMLLLDQWQWVRADQSYTELLTKEQARKVISIQLDDAYKRPYASAMLRDESMHDRLAPGTGETNTVGFVEMLKESGVSPEVVGVEVANDELMKKGIDRLAQYTYDNAVKVLKTAWPELLPKNK